MTTPPYGQAGHFGQPGDHVPPPPPRPRRKLPWLLAGGALLVVAIVVVLIITLRSDPDTGSPATLRDAAITAVNAGDVDALRPLLCQGDALPPELTAALGAGKDLVTVQAQAAGDPVQHGDTATAAVTVHVGFGGQAADGRITLSMRSNAGSWCIDLLTTDISGR